MDASRTMGFMSSVDEENSLCCPACGTVNTLDSKFCMSCGAVMVPPRVAGKKAPAFEAAAEPVAPVGASKYVEPKSAFAEGLPAWSLEPPQVVVRRR